MGEILEVLQGRLPSVCKDGYGYLGFSETGPVLCGPMKLPRLLVRATSDSALGWITMAGNVRSQESS